MKNSENNNNFGLPRNSILRGKQNFGRIFQQGSHLAAKTVDLKYILVDNSEGGCLAGFVTGRRLGKAVHRNKIRRRLREAYRLNDSLIKVPGLHPHSQLHIVFLSKNIHASFQDIQQDIISLLNRLRERLDKQLRSQA